MVTIVTHSPVFPSSKNFCKALTDKHPEIKTIVQNINDRTDSMVLADREKVLYGPGYIEDYLCGKKFRISSRSFYQVNSEATEILYGEAVKLAGLTGKEIVFDAYSGIGTIGIIASDKASKVISVESNKDAVRDAIKNAGINNDSNIEFYYAVAGRFMFGIASEVLKADVVFMDSPRNGSDEAFLTSVIKLNPSKVVYISCGPESLSRDLKVLTKGGYRLEHAECVDLFPHTKHVETVCLLVLRNEITHINIDVDVEELVRDKRGQATYDQIRDFVKEQTGLHVSNLNIAQIKQKCGIIERENYNLPKSEDARQPNCTEDKEEAITKAFEHFGLI